MGGASGGSAGSTIVGDASADVSAPKDGGAEASTTCAPPCGPGQYCNGSNRTCTACSDLSRLQFGPPSKLEPTSAGPAQNQSFPREASRANFRGLLYSFDSQAQTGIDIAFASGAPPTWPTGTALPAPIAAVGVDEAPLPMNSGLDFAFLFDGENTGVRGIYAAGMGAGGWTRTLFGAPGTALNAGGNNYHVAAQIISGMGMPDAIGRMWWTTDRASPIGAGVVRLATAYRTDASAVDVPMVQNNGCHTGGDLEPWVVPSGNVLFFSSLIYVGTTCSDNGDAKRRLSYTQVDPATGQQVGRATAVSWHVTGFDDRAPSLTVDMCSLLFASDRDGGGELDLYISGRN
jgi:hypothetical protein